MCTLNRVIASNKFPDKLSHFERERERENRGKTKSSPPSRQEVSEMTMDTCDYSSGNLSLPFYLYLENDTGKKDPGMISFIFCTTQLFSSTVDDDDGPDRSLASDSGLTDRHPVLSVETLPDLRRIRPTTDTRGRRYRAKCILAMRGNVCVTEKR